ncbi:MAG: beta-propeller domain-containing protein, partial [Oscillospiraceae bacterium]|nr:beta-propeller domain-containing protein [Oscillospiraceae bacterium]
NDIAGFGEEVVEDAITDETVGSLNDGNASAEQKKEYSDTYNQEIGVLEADIVKTDGNNIYYAYGDTIKYAQVKDGKFLKTNNFYNTNGDVNDMYLYNNMLVVISTVYKGGDMDVEYSCCTSEEISTCISFYSSGDNPQLIGSYSQEGMYNDVRLTDNGYLYLVSNTEKYYNSKEITSEDFEEFIPSYSVNNEVKYVEPDCIMIPEYCPDDMYFSSAFANISAFSLNSEYPFEPTDVKSVAGFSGTIYCSYENLYLTYGYEDTEITRFSIKDGSIIPQASGKVKGYVNDQFSMSEYNGYFRIATTINTWNNPWRDVFGSESQEDYNNCLYVLDMELREVGKVKDFGLDEMIKSVNFQGNIAYIVTFRQTDPLYALDLSDPKNPVIMDEFKINGFSSYMQKWSDNLLLGFGQSADDSGTITGVKLTMFDNTDPENLSALDTVEINFDNEGYVLSDAVWERKALLIDSDKNVIGFPVTEGTYNENSESYYIFYSFKDGHFNYLNKVQNDMEYDSFNRAIIIGEYIYMLSNLQFKSADMATFENIQSVTFNYGRYCS